MSGLKGIAKGGWHPKGKGEGGKESWRADFKGVNTVAGWMGKGKSPAEEAREHQSAPLSTLKDPDSFGPPPKHRAYYGDAAASSTGSGSRPDTGLGAASSSRDGSAISRLQEKQNAEAEAEEEANKPPPGPYRTDTTGLSTAHLPKPPSFRPGQAAGTPPSDVFAKSKPKLPPRLPPRQNSRPDAHSQPPPPPYSEGTSGGVQPVETLNQGALKRLGEAGVSVPSLDIGRTVSPPIPPRQTASPASQPASPGPGASRGPQLSELHARFSKMSTSSADTQPAKPGTSWADKQAALRTANNFRTDPSKVSLSDLRGAASTANNFRERHGAEAAAGLQAANNFNHKYGVVDSINAHGESTPPLQSPSLPTQPALGKKPAPPPPPKKKIFTSAGGEPPPIPLGSKPKV